MKLDNALGLTPMNYQIMCEVYDWLVAGGDEKCAFDYKLWHSDLEKRRSDTPRCGTSACLGGKLEFELFHNVSEMRMWQDIADKAELPRVEANKLFFHGGGSKVSPKVAAICLHNFMRDGHVMWHLAHLEAEKIAKAEVVTA
jgi:hypothetical protein